MDSHQRRGVRRAALKAAAVLLIGSAALACDIPIYQAAATDWPPQIYSLYYCTQDGLKANADTEKLFETGLKSWMENVNIDRIKIDVKRPVFSEDKEVLAKRGIRALPYAALTDKDGNVLGGAAGPFTAETWQTFEAVTKPAGPFKVLAFTSPRGEPVVDDPKAATPLPLTIIDFNQATDEQLAQATALGVDRYRVPYIVLLDKSGKKIAEIVEGKLDAAGWAQMQRAAAPAGPFKVTVFTKTELGAPRDPNGSAAAMDRASPATERRDRPGG